MSDVSIPALCARCARVYNQRLSETEARVLGLDPNRAIQPLHLGRCSEDYSLLETEKGGTE